VLTRRQEKVLQFSRAEGGFKPRGSDIATIRVLELSGLVGRIDGGRYIATELGASLPGRVSPPDLRAQQIVSFLKSGGEGLQAADIANALKIRRPLIYGVLRMLRDTGVVEHRAGPGDTSDKRIFLTETPKSPRQTS
jgi:hypothetical protein